MQPTGFASPRSARLRLTRAVRQRRTTVVALAHFNTQRLVLRPFELEDTDALFAFMSDALAMRHTYVAPSREQCLHRLSTYEAMRPTLGFAPWVLRTSVGGPVIGWGGLSIDPEEPEWGLEVGYALAPSVWGNGFATELVRFSLGFAFQVLSAPEVHAFAKPENLASIKVLQKSRFVLLRYEPSLQRNHYVATASAA